LERKNGDNFSEINVKKNKKSLKSIKKNPHR